MINKVSILLAVTHDSHQLEACLESVIQEETPNLELVVVLSQDNPKLRDKIEVILSRRKPTLSLVFEQMNTFELGEIRHRLLELSTGDTLFWLNQDDFIERKRAKFSDFIENAKENQSDLAVGTFIRFIKSEGQYRFRDFSDDVYLLSPGISKFYIQRLHEFTELGGKLIAKDLFQGVSVEELGEAEFKLVSKLLRRAKNTIFIRQPYYVRTSDTTNLASLKGLSTTFSVSDLAMKSKWYKQQGYHNPILETMSIAFCVDETYSHYLHTLIYALARNEKCPLDIYVIYDKLSDDSKKRLLFWNKQFEHLTVKLIPITENELECLQSISLVNNKLPLASYFRMMLPRLLPHLPRVLYMDVDMLVTSSLRELWETDLSGEFMACVKDIPMLDDYNSWAYYLLGENGDKYFNSGLLLMDLHLLRQENVMERLISFTSQNAFLFILGDQDAFNIYFQEAVKYLPLTYNYVLENFKKFPYSEALPSVIHYCGYTVTKPWKKNIGYSTRQSHAIELYQLYQEKAHIHLETLEE